MTIDPTVTALPGIDDADPFQQIADEEAAHSNALEAVEDAVLIERSRCSHAVQEALEQAAARGLTEQSPIVRILSAIKHKIEVG